MPTGKKHLTEQDLIILKQFEPFKRKEDRATQYTGQYGVHLSTRIIQPAIRLGYAREDSKGNVYRTEQCFDPQQTYSPDPKRNPKPTNHNQNELCFLQDWYTIPQNDRYALAESANHNPEVLSRQDLLILFNWTWNELQYKRYLAARIAGTGTKNETQS